jgi:hypothetical protein
MLIWSKHICIFLVHVFHEAFYFQTLLKVIPGYRVLSVEIWSRFWFFQRMTCGLQLMEFLVFLKNVSCTSKVWFGLPQCFGYWIADPFDQIFIASSTFPVLQDLFHFIYFFSFFYVWWWSDIIFSINLVFSIRSEQCSMEDLVNSPRFQEFQLIGYRSQHKYICILSSRWKYLIYILDLSSQGDFGLNVFLFLKLINY